MLNSDETKVLKVVYMGAYRDAGLTAYDIVDETGLSEQEVFTIIERLVNADLIGNMVIDHEYGSMTLVLPMVNGVLDYFWSEHYFFSEYMDRYYSALDTELD